MAASTNQTANEPGGKPGDGAGNRTMGATEWGLLVFLSLIWGGSFFFNGVAVTALPSFTIVAARVTIGALCLIAVLKATGGRMPPRKMWGQLFLMGLINNAIPFSLIVWGQHAIASGLAAILNATTPLFTVIIAHYATEDEKMTPLRVGGILAGLIGVAVLIGGDALAGLSSAALPAEIAVLLASVSYAISSIYGRRFSRAGLAPLATATGQISAAAIIMVPVALIVDQPWHLALPGLPVIGALLGIGAISTCLAYIVFYRILATAGSVNLMLVTLLIPPSAILLGALFLHERLEANDFLGMAAIALGLLAIDGRVVRMFRRRAAAAS